MFNYYTFEGPIISLDDKSGILALAGLSARDKIRYTFLINREMEGTRIEGNGTTYTYDNDRLRVYFFTNLVNGSRIHTLNRCDSQQEDSIVTYNRGFESKRRFDLLSGSKKHYVNIWGVSISDWPDGSTLHGLECVYDDNRRRSVISSKLSLVSISDLYSRPTESDKTTYTGAELLQQYFQH
ncbi:MAG: hypothetical protein AB2809_07590 [Candidatus Thiodiazotropha sp.]